MNNDIIYNFINDIITDRFGSYRDYCRRSDTTTDVRWCNCLCVNYLFHCKILHTEEEMRPSRSLSFFFLRIFYNLYNERRCDVCVSRERINSISKRKSEWWKTHYFGQETLTRSRNTKKNWRLCGGNSRKCSMSPNHGLFCFPLTFFFSKCSFYPRIALERR